MVLEHQLVLAWGRHRTGTSCRSAQQSRQQARMSATATHRTHQHENPVVLSMSWPEAAAGIHWAFTC